MYTLSRGLNLARKVSPLIHNSIFVWARSDIGGLTRHTKFLPHTLEYLNHQQEICAQQNVHSELVTLEKGMKLIGPMHSNDILLGSRAVYPSDNLNLSTREVANIIANSNAITDFILKETLQCLKSKGDNGQDVFYIHSSKLKVGELKSSEELLDVSPVATP